MYVDWVRIYRSVSSVCQMMEAPDNPQFAISDKNLILTSRISSSV
jgi:hypothetical protein